MPVLRMTFEVFGRVQGVHFRKYTKREADSVSAVGWCMNTGTGTVIGEVQGDQVCEASGAAGCPSPASRVSANHEREACGNMLSSYFVALPVMTFCHEPLRTRS